MKKKRLKRYLKRTLKDRKNYDFMILNSNILSEFFSKHYEIPIMSRLYNRYKNIR